MRADQQPGEQPAAYGRGPGGAEHAHWGHRAAAVDEQPVEPPVHEIGDDDGDDDRRGPAQRLQALAEDDEEEERQDPGCEAPDVHRRERHDLGGLVGQSEHRAGQQKHRDRRHRQDERQEDSPLNAACDGGLVFRAHRLGDHGVEHHQRAHPEDADAEEVKVSEGDGGEADRGPAVAEVAYHHRVHYAHQHHPDLDDDDRHGEAQHGTQLGRAGGGAGRPGSRTSSSGGNRGADGVALASRAREQALGEVHALGELGNLAAEHVELVQDFGGQHVPAGDSSGSHRFTRRPSASRNEPLATRMRS